MTERQKVSGVGGMFFRSADPKALSVWYDTHLGVDPVPEAYGLQPWHAEGGPTVLAPFPMESDYFGLDKPFMLNFRVADLDAMVAQLRADGVEVKMDEDSYPNGRFARLHDPEGNPIELWQPA